jgi:hypothetical protein
MVRHRTRVILAILWLDIWRKLIVIELLCHVWQGQSHWRLLPLEMLYICTCYNQLHWRWFGYVSLCYWTMWPSLILARFRFLIDHVSGPLLFHMSVFYWHTCCVVVGSRVISSLDHVSYFYWSMWPFRIWPHVTVLSIHVSFFNSATWLDGFLPRVRFLFGHVPCHDYFTYHALVRPRIVFLFDHMVFPGSTTCPTINPS